MVKANTKIPRRKFGVEIECCSAFEQSVIASKVKKVVHNVDTLNHNYHSHKLYSWGFEADGSIDCDYDEVPLEIISPPLVGKDGLKEIKKVLNVITPHCKTNSSCGLHVTIDVKDLSLKQIKTIILAYTYFEGVIKLFLRKSRSNNRYCKPLANHVSDLALVASLQDISNLNVDRYMTINVPKIHRKRLMEFRSHHGTLDYEEIREWVIFLLKFVDKAKNINISKLPYKPRPMAFLLKVLFNLLNYEDAYLSFLKRIGTYWKGYRLDTKHTCNWIKSVRGLV